MLWVDYYGGNGDDYFNLPHNVSLSKAHWINRSLPDGTIMRTLEDVARGVQACRTRHGLLCDPTKPTMAPPRNECGVKDPRVELTYSGGVKEKDAFFQLIPTDAHSRTPLRYATDFDDSTESIREWKHRYEKFPQVKFHDSKSDQRDA